MRDSLLVCGWGRSGAGRGALASAGLRARRPLSAGTERAASRRRRAGPRPWGRGPARGPGPRAEGRTLPCSSHSPWRRAASARAGARAGRGRAGLAATPRPGSRRSHRADQAPGGRPGLQRAARAGTERQRACGLGRAGVAQAPPLSGRALRPAPGIGPFLWGLGACSEQSPPRLGCLRESGANQSLAMVSLPEFPECDRLRPGWGIPMAVPHPRIPRRLARWGKVGSVTHVSGDLTSPAWGISGLLSDLMIWPLHAYWVPFFR